jgi:aryl-alcohol dehydrogenase-like predicted oxidoreductase
VEQRGLGRTELTVSRLILGGGGFGGFGSDHDLIGKGETDGEAAAIMDAAWDAGIDTFDTADAYGGGRSELAIGKWMKSRGVTPKLATKTFHPMAPGEDHGLAADRIRRQVDSSLERLGVERIDLYLTHQPDDGTPLDQTLGALDELVASGKIGAYGGSHVTAELLREADGRYAWIQNSYSLLDQADAREVLPIVEAERLGYTPFSPLAGGWLTGKYEQGLAPPPASRMSMRPGPYTDFVRADVWHALDRLREWSKSHGITPAEAAYAWVLGEPGVTAVLIGPRQPAHVSSAVGALSVRLTATERAELASLFLVSDRTED